MKTKKKSSQSKSTNTIKILFPQKAQQNEKIANISTKQRTFATIQQQSQTFQNEDSTVKKGFKPKVSFFKKSYIQRMEERQLSPFSQDEGGQESIQIIKASSLLKGMLKVNNDEDGLKLNLGKKPLSHHSKGKTPKSARVQSITNRKVGIGVGSSKTPRSSVANIHQPHNQVSSSYSKKKSLSTTSMPTSTRNRKNTTKQHFIKPNSQVNAQIAFQNEFLLQMNAAKTKLKQPSVIMKSQLSETEEAGAEAEGECFLQIDSINVNNDKDNHMRLMAQNKQCKRNHQQQSVLSSSGIKTTSPASSILKASNKSQLIMQQMQAKIDESTDRQFPNLSWKGKRFVSAIVMLQRLLQQTKIKQLFKHYNKPVTMTSRRPKSTSPLSHRNNKRHIDKSNTDTDKHQNIQKNKQLQSYAKHATNYYNDKQLALTSHKTLKNIASAAEQKTKKPNMSPRLQNLSDSCSNKQAIVEAVSFHHSKSIEDFSPIRFVAENDQNEKIIKESQQRYDIDKAAMMKIVEHYRQTRLSQHKTSRQKNKPNYFSLKSSLSEKCLMQKCYSKIFNEKPSQNEPRNYELFNGLGQKQSQKSIQLFKKQTQKLSLKIGDNHKIVDDESKQNETKQIQKFGRETDQIEKDDKLNTGLLMEQSEDEEEIWVRSNTCYSDQQTPQKYKLLLNSNKSSKVSSSDDDEISTPVSELSSFSKQPSLKEQLSISKKADYHEVVEENSKCTNSQPATNQQKKIKEEDKKKVSSQYSLKSIGNVSQLVMAYLFEQFSKQFINFTSKQCLTKKKRKSRKQQQLESQKKKSRIPGVTINSQLISNFIMILIEKILKHNVKDLANSLQIFSSNNYAKRNRVVEESLVYELFDFDDEDDEDDCYWDFISGETLIETVQKYEKENLVIPAQMQKFSNSLKMYSRYHIQPLKEAFLEILMDKALKLKTHPWDRTWRYEHQFIVNLHRFPQEDRPKQIKQNNKANQSSRNCINQLLESTRKQIVEQSMFKIGQQSLNRYTRPSSSNSQGKAIRSTQEILNSLSLLKQSDENMILKMIRYEFIEEKKDQVRDNICFVLKNELSELIFQALMDEVELEMLASFHQCAKNSQQSSKAQSFLQTNQTMENPS